jgi:hypothetical protein
MANTINNVNDAAAILAKAAAGILSDNTQFCKSIDKAPEEDYMGKSGYKAGQTIQISKPARFIPQTSFDITSSIQDIVEEKTPLTLDVISTVGVEIDSLEDITELGIAQMAERVVKPAMEAIAQDIEVRFLEKATQTVYNSVGTAGSNNFTVSDIQDSKVKLNQFLAPKDTSRRLLVDAVAGAAAVVDRKGLFQSSSEIASQYKMGYMGMSDGYTWLENELLYSHTNGNNVTGVAVDDAAIVEGASTLHVDGLTATTGTVTKGTVFTIAGVNAVHPITKKVYTFLQQFVVTADATADGAGDADLAISPSLYAGSGGLQNIDALPADDAALVFVGAADSSLTQNLAFHKSAFRMVSAPLMMPTNAEFAAQATVDGITVAIVRDFDVNTRSMVTRVDFLGGIASTRPEWACRLTA